MSTARLMDPRRDLSDPARFVKIENLPILDAHSHNEKGDVSEAMLRRIVANTNARISHGDPPAVTAGHTARKNNVVIIRPDGGRILLPGTQELDQPPVLGYASSFRMGKHNGNSCIFADWYIHREHANTIKGLPYRSAERLESTNGVGGDFIDRVAALKSPPERDLGTMIAYEQSGSPDCSGVKRICYERPCFGGSCGSARPIPIPTTTTRSSTPMNSEIRRIAYEAALDADSDMNRIMSQYNKLTRLRDSGKDIPDDELERLALLDADDFAREYETVRTCYNRRAAPISASWLRAPDAGDCARALDRSTTYGITYGAAKKLVQEARHYARENGCSQDQAERTCYHRGYGTPTAQTFDGSPAGTLRRQDPSGNWKAMPDLHPPRRPEMNHGEVQMSPSLRGTGMVDDDYAVRRDPPPRRMTPMHPYTLHIMAVQFAVQRGISYDDAKAEIEAGG